MAYVKNGKIENLTINGLTIAVRGGANVGGVVGNADNSTLINLHIDGLNMIGPESSGGLVGNLTNSLLFNASVQGTISQTFGTDGGGGLIGNAINADISDCSSNVTLLMLDNTAYGVSAIGGLIGGLINSRVSNVYARGNIDYSHSTQNNPLQLPHFIGGLIGLMENSLMSNAYYAGKIIVDGTQMGGAVGVAANSFVDTVFWDTQLSGIATSALGVGEVTSTLQQESFWIAQGFDQHYWVLVYGEYPNLLTDS